MFRPLTDISPDLLRLLAALLGVVCLLVGMSSLAAAESSCAADGCDCAHEASVELAADDHHEAGGDCEVPCPGEDDDGSCGPDCQFCSCCATAAKGFGPTVDVPADGPPWDGAAYLFYASTPPRGAPFEIFKPPRALPL